MRRSLLVLAAVAAIGIAVLWSMSGSRSSAAPRPAEGIAPREALVHEIAALPEIAPVAPVERAVAEPEAPAPVAEDLAEETQQVAPSAPRLEPNGTGVLEVVVVARETGAPIAGATVFVWSYDNERSPGLHLETDVDGTAIGAVPADAQLSVTAHLGEGPWVTRTFGPLAPGEQRRLDVELMTDTSLLAVVQVLAADGDVPIAGAQVTLDPEENRDAPRVFTAEHDGRVALELEARVHFALVEATGYGMRRVQVANGQTAGEATCVVRLQRSAALAVSVLDARGAALPDLSVVLTADPSWIDEPLGVHYTGADLRWEQTTAPDGRCFFDDLPPEVPFTLDVLRKRRVLRREGEPVTLAPGESRSIEVSIGAGTKITGVLLDQDGEIVAGSAVWLIAERGGPALPIHERWEDLAVQKTSTTHRGRFTFRDVPPGSWWIGPVLSDSAKSVAGLPELVEIEPGSADREVVLRGQRGLTIAGRVVDPDGEQVEGVYVYSESGMFKTDAEGKFEIGPLLPGTYTLGVEASFMGWAGPDELIVEAGAKDVVIEVVRGGTVHVEVRDDSGKTAGAKLLLTREAFRRMGDASAGAMEFSGLRSGSYTVVAQSAVGWGIARGVDVEGGSTADVEIVLAPAARLVIRYAGTNAYGHFEVWAGDTLVQLVAMPTGTSRACSVPAGELRIAMRSGAGTEERTVDAQVGELVEAVFE